MNAVGRKITVVAVTAALGTAVGVTYRLVSNKERQEAGSSIFAPLKFTRDDPSVPLLSRGARATLPQAVKSANFTMYRPSAPQASDQSITQVWMGPGPQPDIAIRYSSGLRLYYARFPAGRSSSQEVAAFYSNLAQEFGHGWTQTINGHPAWFLPRILRRRTSLPTQSSTLPLGRSRSACRASSRPMTLSRSQTPSDEPQRRGVAGFSPGTSPNDAAHCPVLLTKPGSVVFHRKRHQREGAFRLGKEPPVGQPNGVAMRGSSPDLDRS
jgi:hypothetical protein